MKIANIACFSAAPTGDGGYVDVAYGNRIDMRASASI